MLALVVTHTCARALTHTHIHGQTPVCTQTELYTRQGQLLLCYRPQCRNVYEPHLRFDIIELDGKGK